MQLCGLCVYRFIELGGNAVSLDLNLTVRNSCENCLGIASLNHKWISYRKMSAGSLLFVRRFHIACGLVNEANRVVVTVLDWLQMVSSFLLYSLVSPPLNSCGQPLDKEPLFVVQWSWMKARTTFRSTSNVCRLTWQTHYTTICGHCQYLWPQIVDRRQSWVNNWENISKYRDKKNRIGQG